MIYKFLQNNLILLLVFSIALGLFGLFLYRSYLKKICCLSISYSSLIILMILLFKDSEKSSELFPAIVTILIIFSVILATGIGIISNASKLEEVKKSGDLNSN